MLGGQFFLCIWIFAAAALSFTQYDYVFLGLIGIHLFTYMVSTRNAVHVIETETLTDTGLSLALTIENMFALFEEFSFPEMLASPLKVPGTFIVYGTILAISVPFVYFFVPETSGLSEKEKKQVFLPGATYGRKLKEGEKYAGADQHKSRATVMLETKSAQISG